MLNSLTENCRKSQILEGPEAVPTKEQIPSKINVIIAWLIAFHNFVSVSFNVYNDFWPEKKKRTKSFLLPFSGRSLLLNKQGVPRDLKQQRRLRTTTLIANSSNVGEFFWSLVPRDCIEFQEKKKKVVVLCSRPSRNVKLGTFTS